ncbi:MAG: hypothetical protein H6708_27885 [Kofleriaceae bacterium]|nr:hypothetical protein [Kofleriaceae bacterium]
MTDDDHERAATSTRRRRRRLGVGVVLALATAVGCSKGKEAPRWQPRGELPPRVVDAMRTAYQVATTTSAARCREILPDHCSHDGSPPGVPYGRNALDGRASVADYRIACLWAPAGSSVGTCEFEPASRGGALDRSFGMSYRYAPGYHSLGHAEPGDEVLVNDSDLPYRGTVVYPLGDDLLVRVTVVVAADDATTGR